MKILAISDSHGSDFYIRDVIKKNPGTFDKCFHMGDIEGQEESIKSFLKIPVEIVKGNCDWFSALSENLCFNLGNHTCLMTHGHLYGAKGGLGNLVSAAKANGADYVFFGHTHRPIITEIDGITLMNPGSISRPVGDRPSYGVIEVDDEGKIHLSLSEI